jgi:hypothetical protein
MNYKNKLLPWCIIRLLPNLQRLVVARFRRRSHAEAHLQILKQLVPNITHTIIFDIAPENPLQPQSLNVSQITRNYHVD